MIEQNEFRGWAKVEVMGHRTHIGFVTTEAYGGTVLFRIDQPALPEEKGVTLQSSEYAADGRWCNAGTVVDYQAMEGASVLIGAGSIYAITPCTEAAAMKAIRASVRRPLLVVSLPAPQIEAGVIEGEDDDDDEGEPSRDGYRAARTWPQG